ncbi:MAG: hypothetical protein EA365_03385 [Gloeocapsa sp. DLM2.Bin57]|nr:MAG: hypothetical protein EA365_03385 [Gloeocapsa sp. DLM2.Bin57]
MSKGDNFGGGFLLGTVIGGLVGTVVGIVIGSKSNEISEPKQTQPLEEELDSKPLPQEEITENLEAKISQLSSAIEEVRQKLNLKD